MWMLFAFVAAVCYGFRGVLYHWTSGRPMNRNLMLCGVFFTGFIVSVAGTLLTGQVWSYGAWIGILMGTFSFMANASLYKGFAVGKASLVAIITALPPVVVAIAAYIFWNEALSVWQLTALVVIITGVIMIRYSNELSFKNLQGAQWGLLAMLFFASNDLATKQSTRLEADMFPTLCMMFGTGSFLFCVWWLMERRKGTANSAAVREEASINLKSESLPWKETKTFFWGMIVGTTNISGSIFIMAAFERGVTGLVSAIVAVNVLIILLYSRLFGKERFSPLQLAGMGFSLLGIVVLRAF
ncbi:EamA family transporter [Marinicrinis lubricantis]|uniref:EamA family transporter n=1 Tax=Marinicrinis lubricantis TaxID=2086470 RepID=A0ABW1IRC8_9BACL